MSPAIRSTTSWLAAMYDRVVLVAALVALLFSTLFLVLQIGRVRFMLSTARWDQPPTQPKAAQPADEALFAKAEQALASPFQVAERPQRLLTSELRVSCVNCQKPIPFNAAACPFCGAVQPEIKDPTKIDSDGDGIPDGWELKYSLNTGDPADGQMDLDGDGFTNFEEYKAGTDPNNPDDHPSLAAKLRVRGIKSEPFFLRFQGVNQMPDGSTRYQLNLRSLERTYFAQIGEVVEGFKLLEYQPETPGGPAVVMEQGSKRITLHLGRAIQQQEMVAQLVFLIDRTPMRAVVGDVITLKEQQYKVIDIKRNAVLIRDVKTQKDTEVPMLAPGDLTPGGGGRASAAPSDGAAAGLFPEM